MSTAPTRHTTKVDLVRWADGTKEHVANCTCGWEAIGSSKPNADWKARMHRLTHLKDTS